MSFKALLVILAFSSSALATPNYYDVLGVTRKATQTQIRQAYLQNDEDPDVQQAFLILSSPARRAQYDRRLKEAQEAGEARALVRTSDSYRQEAERLLRDYGDARDLAARVTDEAKMIVLKAWIATPRVRVVRDSQNQIGAYQLARLFENSFPISQARAYQAYFENLVRLSSSDNLVAPLYFEEIKRSQNEFQDQAITEMFKAGPPTNIAFAHAINMIREIQGPNGLGGFLQVIKDGDFSASHRWKEAFARGEGQGSVIRRLQREREQESNDAMDELLDLHLGDHLADLEWWSKVCSALAKVKGRELTYILGGDVPEETVSNRAIALKSLMGRSMTWFISATQTIILPGVRNEARVIKEAVIPAMRYEVGITDEAAKILARGGMTQEQFNRDYEKVHVKKDINSYGQGILREQKAADREIELILSRYLSSPKSNLKPESFQHFFETLLQSYFARLSERGRVRILLALAKNPNKNLTDADKFRIIVHNVGPNLQKLLQSVAREPGLDPEFAQTLKEMESNLPVPPLAQVEADLQRLYPSIYPSKVKIIDPHPLGAGTMAITYKAEVFRGRNQPGTLVALRVLRPGLAADLAEEEEILIESAKIIEAEPELKGTVFENYRAGILEPVLQNTREELDLALTRRNQKSAEQAYAPDKKLKEFGRGRVADIVIPKIIGDSLGQGLMAQELISGQSYEDFFKEHPDLKMNVTRDLAAFWLREAIFRSGFHHADPHQGNMLFRLAPNGRVQIYLLDFGLSKKVSTSLRRNLLLLAVALDEGQIQAVYEKAFELVKPASRTARLHEIVEAAVKDGETGVEAFLERLVRNNINLVSEVASFRRGLFLINQLLEGSGGSDTSSTLLRSIAEDVLPADAQTRLMSAGLLRRSPLKFKDLLHLQKSQGPRTGALTVANKCENLFR